MVSATSHADVVDRLASQIEESILVGTHPIGSWLRQERLAEEYGVSRTPVREALRKLAAVGLVELVPRRGALVRGRKNREIREAYEVRAELEAFAAERAAIRATEDDIKQLRQAASTLREASLAVTAAVDAGRPGDEERREWVEAADLFHRLIFDVADNDRLRWSVNALTASFSRSLTLLLLDQDERDQVFEENICEHESVLRAIEHGDGTAARWAMRAHLLSVGQQVLSVLERRSA